MMDTPTTNTGRLQGRRILVTGAASGIGAAILRRFIAEGARVAALDRNADALQAQAAPLGALALTVDVCDAAGVREAVASAAAQLGGLDGIVNAAGVSVIADFAATDEAAWQRSLDINLTGPYRICHAALPWLQQARAATIVNISSGAALQPLARRTAYAASKAGLIAFTKVLAVELAPTIRANSLLPGAVDTPMAAQAMGSVPRETLVARYALKRLGTADEIADAVLFLTSDESSFVTGSTLSVDGGRIFH